MSASDKRLIEEALPLREISDEAAREKNIRHGHISTLHTWWARRPLVACRAAVLGSLIPDPSDGKERKRILDFLVKFCRWEASNDSKLIEEARRLIMEANGGQRPKVLDCFAGGGAIPLEATRLGCDSYALELNPVAILIELCTLVYPQRYGKPFEVSSKQSNIKGEKKMIVRNRLAFDVDRWGKWILQEARKDLKRFYPPDPDGKIPLAYLWARTVKCPNPNCGVSLPLIRQLWLADTEKRHIALKILPDKHKREVLFEVVEGKNIDFDPKQATMRLGSVECPVCKHPAKGTYLRTEASANRLGQQQIAIVLSEPDKHKKFYRVTSREDLNPFNEASAVLDKKTEAHRSKKDERLSLIPNEPISRPPERLASGDLAPFYVHLQVVNYGISTWGQLFNARQALALTTFAHLVQEVYANTQKETNDSEYAKAVTTYLALVLGRVADYSSNICRWHNTFEMIANTFARQAIPMVWDYAEVNPLERTVGAWLPMLEAGVRVIEKWSFGEPCDVKNGTATQLGFPDDYFDAIITDPPYYDAVPYSDLSDFFYVWLKRTIGFLYPPLFATPLSPKGEEIIKNSSLLRRAGKFSGENENGVKSSSFFEKQMTKALIEANRVLKPDGVLAIVFAHKTIGAWETLIGALLNAHFTITSSWPLHTEQRQRLRAHGSAALASSVWLICRKLRPNAGVRAWKSVQTELDKRVKNRLDYFLSQGIKGADALLSAIGPALEVFGKYERVEKITGDTVSIVEFLDKVREAVAHHALATVLSEQELGNVDAPTAFYVLWKWTFEPTVQNGKSANSSTKEKGNGNDIPVPYDDALKLARSVGADAEVLLKTYILKQEKENVVLLGPNERKHVPGLGETARDGTPPATIDMIHRSLNLWAGMEQAQLEEYLEKSGARNNETFWRVAQALSNLLPLQSKEKQLLDGLLARHAGGAEALRPHDTKSLDEFIKKEEK